MVGPFKDDQIINHNHAVNLPTGSGNSVALLYDQNKAEGNYAWGDIVSNPNQGFGSTTHGKQKGVKFIIKVL